MKSTQHPKRAVRLPATVMVWSITDREIEDAGLREKEFSDLRSAGFEGVLAVVRCSRYSWNDQPARKAIVHIGSLCRKAGVSFWIGPDPRFVSHQLTDRSRGIELLLYGDAVRASTVPHTIPVRDGRFSIRCTLAPRHVHTLTDVAVEFRPIGLAGVFAVRQSAGPLGAGDVVDITRHAQLFYNARDGYVEAFGAVPIPDPEGWHVTSFFHVRTNHADFSDAGQISKYERMLAELKKETSRVDAVTWDEPGYTCVYGALPYSPAIRRLYRSVCRRDLTSDLWKLAFDTTDRSHIPVRVQYYRSVQRTITRAETRLKKTAKRLWGKAALAGIHDTWHFESADMSDMNHGSLNLWESVPAKDGGFVDLGAVQELHNPDSPWYRNLAAMTVAAASLGKLSTGRFAYNNLWTVGDDAGDGSQAAAMDHCVKTMALFGIRWLAHAYGPVGTIGQERTFLGSPPLPGYPDHSTWRNFPSWNEFLKRQYPLSGNRLPSSNLLVLFPVETLYSYGDSRADERAAKIFELVLALLDNQYHVDLVATTSLRAGMWSTKPAGVGIRTDFVVFPFPEVLSTATKKVLSMRQDAVLYAFEQPRTSEWGRPHKTAPTPVAGNIADVLQSLERVRGLRPVQAPRGSWVTLTPVTEGMTVSVAPARCGREVEGAITFGQERIDIPRSSALRRILFADGKTRILEPPRGAIS